MALEWWRTLNFILLVGVYSLFSEPCYSALKYSFVHQATTAPLIAYYDYIVVGGGTAGCSLAATLSERADVLLLERGGSPYGNANVEDIEGFDANLVDLSPSSPAQQFVSEDGVMNARARVLGGGSAINAGFFTRASREFVASVGLDEGLVNRSYEWVENKVAFKPPMLQFQSAVRDGLLEAGVLPDNGFTYDHIYGTKVGGSIFDGSGHRHTATELLAYADQARTTVYLHATVQKILFKTTRRFRTPTAGGVIYTDRLGIMHRAYLRAGPKNEIILSAGAIGSPQMLMLSGIGPANQLTPLGINVVIDQHLVGQGMSDNPMNALFVPSPRPVEVSLIQTVGITRFGSFIEASSGSNFARAFALNLPQVTEAFPSQANQSAGVPHTQTIGAGRITELHDTINSLINGTLTAGLILEKTDGPLSTGYLRLRTRNPNDNPSVTFNYFKEPEDLERCVRGMQTIIKVIESDSFVSFRYPNMPVQSLINLMVNIPLNLRPRRFQDMFSLEQFCIDTVMTIWHYHGGCQVGKVVDKDYKVYGTERLRVIDGSTFYSSPGTNPQATVMMLGRYMGQRILEERNAG